MVPQSGGALLTVRQVAVFLGVSTATVYKLCSSGDLPSMRVGAALRVSRGGLAGWIAAREG